MHLINYCQVWFDHAHTTSKCLPITNADKCIRRRNANLRKSRLSKRRNVGNSRTPDRRWHAKKNPHGSPSQLNTNRFQQSTPMTQQSHKGVRSGSPPANPSWSAPVKQFPSKMGRITKDRRFQEGALRKDLRDFLLICHACLG